ncbi:hypothetical protein [Stomatohabitans albus]|uniref:type I-G CRISPR-associated protein, Cas3-extension family n=1 Tax=Stomatohabitans albus TaxID=3110766 RepID=UPI00300C5FA7
MNTIELGGLHGNNPMAFLAALGVCEALRNYNAKISWTEDSEPTAVLHSTVAKDELIPLLLEDRDRVLEWPLFEYSDIRFTEEEKLDFLFTCISEEHGIRSSFITDITVDGKGLSKPTDLYFTSGSQKFLTIVNGVGQSLSKDLMDESLFGPWRYSATGYQTLMWDPRDDRYYALTATNPSDTKKSTIPGADWLAFRGLALLPVFGSNKRVLTPGGSGTAGNASWAWPMWKGPLGAKSITALMQFMPRKQRLDSVDWVPPKGVFFVYQSQILRVGQGYGRMCPPKLVWSE